MERVDPEGPGDDGPAGGRGRERGARERGAGKWGGAEEDDGKGGR